MQSNVRDNHLTTFFRSKVTLLTFVPFCEVLDQFQARLKCHSLAFSPLPAPGAVNLMAGSLLLVLELNKYLRK